MRSEIQAEEGPQSKVTAMTSFEERAPCPHLWFEDGNVVLATQTRLFRVHRGILALHSGVFSDMFALPQPEGSVELHEGIPIVELVGDDGDGMQHFLRCIYDRSYVFD